MMTIWKAFFSRELTETQFNYIVSLGVIPKEATHYAFLKGDFFFAKKHNGRWYFKNYDHANRYVYPMWLNKKLSIFDRVFRIKKLGKCL